MELRCPACLSPKVGPRPDGGDEALRCGNCGECFVRDEAFVSVADAESVPAAPEREDLFELDTGRARAELSDPDGVIRVADPYIDADELHRLLDDAQEKEIIRARWERAGISIYPLSIAEPDPVLAVNLGSGPILLGSEPELRGREDEDPVAFTVRILEGVVEELLRGDLPSRTPGSWAVTADR